MTMASTIERKEQCKRIIKNKDGFGIRTTRGYLSLALVVALVAAIPDLEEPLLRIRFRVRTHARVYLLGGSAKQRARSVATAVMIPHPPVVVAIAGHPPRTDTDVLRRAMQAKLHSDRVRTREVRVVRVDEEPRRFGPGAHLAHDHGGRGKGDVACGSGIGGVMKLLVVLDEELSRCQREDDDKDEPDVKRHGKKHVE